MKALVKLNPERGLWMQDVPMPEIGPDDVLIKIRKTAICGTDLHIYRWDEWSQKTINRITSYNVCYTKLLRMRLH